MHRKLLAVGLRPQTIWSSLQGTYWRCRWRVDASGLSLSGVTAFFCTLHRDSDDDDDDDSDNNEVHACIAQNKKRLRVRCKCPQMHTYIRIVMYKNVSRNLTFCSCKVSQF